MRSASAVCLGALLLSVTLTPPGQAGFAFNQPATPEAAMGAATAARSYLEGWFGGTMGMPPIEVMPPSADAEHGDSPGHYQDGVIRLRPQTLLNESELRRVLRHELAHALIDQRTRGNCPHWLQEGIAQFLDGTEAAGTHAALLRRTEPLIPLFRIEGPFQDRDARSRDLAYLESASAVSFLVSRIGRAGLKLIVQRLGEGRSFDESILEAGLSYTELQQAWESSLRPPRRAPKSPPR